jgi:hypothetical protein
MSEIKTPLAEEMVHTIIKNGKNLGRNGNNDDKAYSDEVLISEALEDNVRIDQEITIDQADAWGFGGRPTSNPNQVLIYKNKSEISPARVPKSPSAQEPKCPSAQEPKSPRAQVPKSLSAQEPKCPRAQVPKSPSAQEPMCPSAQEPKCPSP